MGTLTATGIEALRGPGRQRRSASVPIRLSHGYHRRSFRLSRSILPPRVLSILAHPRPARGQGRKWSILRALFLQCGRERGGDGGALTQGKLSSTCQLSSEESTPSCPEGQPFLAVLFPTFEAISGISTRKLPQGVGKTAHARPPPTRGPRGDQARRAVTEPFSSQSLPIG